MGAVVVVGVGELGAVFARGFLKTGHPVFPVTRTTPMADVARQAPEPELALVAVGETDLESVLSGLPASWRGRVGLLQNELLAPSWRTHGIEHPTVAVVWFEKKPTTLVKQLLPSVLYGPGSWLVQAALAAIGVETRVAASESELSFELAGKYLYILTTNVAGIETGGTVSELWDGHRELAVRVARDVIALMRGLGAGELDEARLVSAFATAVAADPGHACTGRSAPARLARALSEARRLGLSLPELERIAGSVR